MSHRSRTDRAMTDRALDALIGKEGVPSIRSERCARDGACATDCRICAEACPHEALWVGPEGRMRLDDASCVGCGACAVACPNAAIDGLSVDADGLRRVLQRNRGATVGCRKGGTRASSGDVAVACLAGLHGELLATLMLERPEAPLRLDLRSCHDCPIGALRGAIEREADRAQAYVRLAGVEPSLVLLDENADDAGGASAAPALSRRALFGLARERAVTLVAESLGSESGGRSRSLPYRDELLAATRRALHERSEPTPELPVEEAFYLDWSVSDACDGCSDPSGHEPACAAACPSDAWRMRRTEAGMELTLDPALCLGDRCRRCESVCPHSALAPRPIALSADAGRGARRSIATARCRSCRRPIPAGGSELCPNCRKRDGATLGPPVADDESKKPKGPRGNATI